MPTIYAQPYAIGASGFEFDSLEDFETKYKAHPNEEFELEFLEGSAVEESLFLNAAIGQHNLASFFEVAELEEYEQLQVGALLFVGVDIEEALERYEGVSIGEHDSAADWAHEYVDAMGGPNELDDETVARYFDYAQFGLDAELGGDIIPVTLGGRQYYAEAWSLER